MRSAFTFIELVIVLMIISIMTAVAVPRFYRALCYHRTESAARRIKADLELSRQRAKVAGAKQEIQFDLASHSYTVPGVERLDRKRSDYDVRLRQSPYEVELASVDFGGQTNVTFNGFGIPDGEGTIIVRCGQYQRAVNLDANGTATIQ